MISTIKQYFGSKLLVYEGREQTNFLGHVSEPHLDGRWWVFPADDDLAALEEDFSSSEKAINRLVEISDDQSSQ